MTIPSYGAQAVVLNGDTYYIPIDGAEYAWATGPQGLNAYLLALATGSGGSLTVGSPANGLNITTNVLTLGAASSSLPGAVTTGTQTISGAKTFETSVTVLGNLSLSDLDPNCYFYRSAADEISAAGDFHADNLRGSASGTNTSDVTLGAFGSTPNSSGISVSGQVVTLQPADATNPGAVSIGTQHFKGAKIFDNGIGSLAPTVINVGGGGGAPAFATGWANFGNPYAPVRFWADLYGYVHLEGLCVKSAGTGLIFTLPAGYRPATNGDLIQVTYGDNAHAQIKVQSDGSVLNAGAATGSLSLWGITFYAAQ